jgi:hypothetical protein
MPAPSPALIAGTRDGSIARHIFFRLTHPLGNVLVWDGIGEFLFNGETYTGVGGFIEVTGVSMSWEIQNTVPSITLNAVPLSAIQTINPNIRGESASLWAVWVARQGYSIVSSKQLFSGLGDVVKSRLNGDTLSLTAFLRSPQADWGATPFSYYNSVDQQRLFPGDSGCDLTSSLENAVIAGWRSTSDIPANVVFYRADFGFARYISNGANVLFGHPTRGPFFKNASNEVRGMNSTDYYADHVTGQRLKWGSLGQPLTCDNVSAVINASGFVYSAAGNLIGRNGSSSTAEGLRQIGAASVGSVTSEDIRAQNFSGKTYPVRTSEAPTANDWSSIIIGADYSTYAFFEDVPTEYRRDTGQLVSYRYRLKRSDNRLYRTSGQDQLIHATGSDGLMFSPVMDAGRLVSFLFYRRSSGGVLITDVSDRRAYASGTTVGNTNLRVWL